MKLAEGIIECKKSNYDQAFLCFNKAQEILSVKI
jgi:hypothetical protein